MKVIEHFAIHDDAALAFGGDGDRAMDQLSIVYAPTGRTRWAIDGTARDSCHSDRTTLIACLTYGGGESAREEQWQMI